MVSEMITSSVVSESISDGMGAEVVVVLAAEANRVKSGRPIPGDHPGGGVKPGGVGSKGTSLVTSTCK